MATDPELLLVTEPHHFIVDSYGFVAVVGDVSSLGETFEAQIKEVLDDIPLVSFTYLQEGVGQISELLAIISRARFTHYDAAPKVRISLGDSKKTVIEARKSSKLYEVARLFSKTSLLEADSLCPKCKSDTLIEIPTAYRNKSKVPTSYYRCSTCSYLTPNRENREKVLSS